MLSCLQKPRSLDQDRGLEAGTLKTAVIRVTFPWAMD